MMLWRHRLLAVLLVTLASSVSHSLELQPYFGNLNYSNLDGCCKSTGSSRLGFGASVRLPTDTLGMIDIAAFTDRRWTEFVILKPLFLMGESSVLDPSGDANIKVRRVSDWKFVFSYGGGYFTHSTRTKNFDLPAITNGIVFTSQSQLGYSINDRLAVVGILQFGIAWAKDDKGTQLGTFLGVNYRP